MSPRFTHLLSRFGPRLGLGLTGLLAATRLLFVASYAGPAGRPEQATRIEAGLTDFSLGRKLAQEVDLTNLITLDPAGPHAYSPASIGLHQARAGQPLKPGRYRRSLRRPVSHQAYPTTGPGTTGLLARSWRTIKTMFR